MLAHGIAGSLRIAGGNCVEDDEVLALRADRMATVRRVVDGLTDEQFAASTDPVNAPGWPPAQPFPVREALGIVINEEWWHRRFAERDLAVLTARA